MSMNSSDAGTGRPWCHASSSNTWRAGLPRTSPNLGTTGQQSAQERSAAQPHSRKATNLECVLRVHACAARGTGKQPTLDGPGGTKCTPPLTGRRPGPAPPPQTPPIAAGERVGGRLRSAAGVTSRWRPLKLSEEASPARAGTNLPRATGPALGTWSTPPKSISGASGGTAPSRDRLPLPQGPQRLHPHLHPRAPA